MKHDMQDGVDAAARARGSGHPRPRPIRYDVDTWLVMRNDPVLPAAIILRVRNPDSREFFITLTWDLDPTRRRLVGRYGSLEDADGAVLYAVQRPVVGDRDEELHAMRARQEDHARRLEREQAERAKLYGP